MRRIAVRIAQVAPAALVLGAVALAASGLLEAGRALRIDGATAKVGFDLPATMHTVHGSAREVKGSVSIVSVSEDGLVLDGEIVIPVGGLATGNDRRDAKMRRESLDAGAHPEIRFVPRKLDRGDPDPSAPSRTRHRLAGELTIRGVTKSAVVPISVEAGTDRIRVDGAFDVRWADHGVPDPSAFVLRVDPVARASFHVELVP
jgi:polyisoprenoid-binding protein YceI